MVGWLVVSTDCFCTVRLDGLVWFGLVVAGEFSLLLLLSLFCSRLCFCCPRATISISTFVSVCVLLVVNCRWITAVIIWYTRQVQCHYWMVIMRMVVLQTLTTHTSYMLISHTLASRSALTCKCNCYCDVWCMGGFCGFGEFCWCSDLHYVFYCANARLFSQIICCCVHVMT